MENRNGQGIFYGVIGVATLVVAIIGATFAYFSAAATNAAGSEAITGQTYDMSSAELSLKITRVNKAVTNATSINLVPTDIDGADPTSVNTAVAAKCEAKGYTACHIYKIEATTSQTLSNVSMNLDSLTVTGSGSSTKKDSWKYSIYEGTDATATAVKKSGAFEVSTPGVEFHGNGQLAAASGGNPSKVYYMIVYIANDTAASQNAGDAKDVTGTYNGTITMSAAGGKVAATFGA